MKKKSKLKGCLKRATIPLCLIGFCVLFAALTLIPIIPKMAVITDYTKMIEELSVQMKDSDMSSNPIGVQDNLDLQEKVNAFVECVQLDEHGNPNSLFDIGGAFIYDNIKKENINIKEDTLEFDKRNFAAFVNSLIGAGWIDGFYDKAGAKKLLNVLDVQEMQTQNGITKLSVIVKTNLKFFGEETSSKDGLNEIDGYLYVSYTTQFKGDEIISATMSFNKLSDNSNKLLLETLFSTKDEEVINENISSIIKELLKQLDKIKTEWDLNYSFVNDKLIISV